MSYHYPIYNLVTRQEGGPTQNFGARNGFRQDIRVGTSKKNSHTLAEISTTYVDLDDGRREFRLFLDGVLMRSGVLDGKRFTPINAEEKPA